MALAVVLWLVFRGGDGEPAPARARATPGDGIPLRVSVAGLRTLARAVPSRIYWLGPRRGSSLELTHTAGNRVFLRYLPSSAAIGSDKPYLTVATYPVADAFAATRRASRQPGAVVVPVGGGAIAFFNRSRPQSVYFTQQGSDYQVEVYDPVPARAREVVAAGKVSPVVDKTAPGAVAVSAAGLRALAAKLGHPLYWLGRKPGVTYELTQTGAGAVFVRYLPSGVAPGANRPYLTVATYPFPRAFAAARRTAARNPTGTIRLPSGGLGVVDAGYPKSIHVAYAGVPYQVEVFDPSPARARAIVSSGKVTAVG